MKKSKKLIALSASNKAYEFDKPLEKRIKYQGKKVDIRLREDPNGFSIVKMESSLFGGWTGPVRRGI